MGTSMEELRSYENKRRLVGLLSVFAFVVVFVLVGPSAYSKWQTKLMERRDLVKAGAEALALGGPVFELFKRVGSPSCQRVDDEGLERLVYHVDAAPEAAGEEDLGPKGSQDQGQPDAEACRERPGDLVVWTRGGKIIRFLPVVEGSELVKDSASFSMFRKRFLGWSAP